MKRRMFLKKSAVGIGTLAGMYGGVLKLEGASWGQESAVAARSGGHGVVETAEQTQLVWGINAVVLKSPWSRSPSVDDLLADGKHTVVLNRFYRVGGENRPATPTECRVAYNSDALFVVFRCEESDMSFPYANLDADSWSEANWHSLHGLPSASNNWPPNPDEVEFLIQPDAGIPSYYQFAATPQGLRFGCERLLSSNTDVSADEAADAPSSSARVSKVEAFEANVTRRTNELCLAKTPSDREFAKS